MKKKLLFVFLAFVLIFAFSVPATALAAKPAEFHDGGAIFGILPSNEFAAGNSGRFVVEERQLVGALWGSLSGYFVLTYHANVELGTQEGTFHGLMDVGTGLIPTAIDPTTGYPAAYAVTEGYASLNVNGQTEFDQGSGYVDFSSPYGPAYAITLNINGNWTFANGFKGTGKFDATLITYIGLPGSEKAGHILGFGDSTMDMTGKWQQ